MLIVFYIVMLGFKELNNSLKFYNISFILSLDCHDSSLVALVKL